MTIYAIVVPKYLHLHNFARKITQEEGFWPPVAFQQLVDRVVHPGCDP